MSDISLLVLGMHLVGDFVIQTDRMAAKKFESVRARLDHVASYHLAFLPAIFFLTITQFIHLIVFSAVTHYIIDSERWAKPKEQFENYPIWVDQALHIISLGLIVALL